MDQINKNNNDEPSEFLQGLKDKSSFKVPANYFAEMQNAVLDKVLVEKSPIPQDSSWTNFWKILGLTIKPSYALSAITLAVVGLLLFPTSDIPSSTDAFATLSDTDLEYFLNNELETLDGEELMAIVSPEETDITLLPIQIESIEMSADIPEDYIIEIEDSALIDFSEE